MKMMWRVCRTWYDQILQSKQFILFYSLHSSSFHGKRFSFCVRIDSAICGDVENINQDVDVKNVDAIWETHPSIQCIQSISKSMAFHSLILIFRMLCVLWSHSEQHTEKELNSTLRAVAVFVLIHLYYLYLAMVTEFVSFVWKHGVLHCIRCCAQLYCLPHGHYYTGYTGYAGYTVRLVHTESAWMVENSENISAVQQNHIDGSSLHSLIYNWSVRHQNRCFPTDSSYALCVFGLFQLWALYF